MHEKLLAENADDYTPAVRTRMLTALNIPAVDYIRAQRARQAFSVQMAESTKHVDVLATPSIPVLAHSTIKECTVAPGEALAEKSHEIPTLHLNLRCHWRAVAIGTLRFRLH